MRAPRHPRFVLLVSSSDTLLVVSTLDFSLRLPFDAFVNFMEKKSCTKFCGVLVRFHEIIELQSFEFSVSDVISTNVQNISSLVFFAFFC